MKAFISHSSMDKALARVLSDQIHIRGGNAWLDERELGSGMPLATALASAIDQVDIFVILITKHSVASSWVKFEINLAMTLAIERGIRILPLKASDVEVPIALRGYIYADISDEVSLARALNLAFVAPQNQLPLPSELIRARYDARILPDMCMRIVRTVDLDHSHSLGVSDRKYVFAGDYFEQCGRPLREVLENLYVGMYLDSFIRPNDEFSVVVFETGHLYAKKVDLLPGTWRAVYRIITDPRRLGIFGASQIQEIDGEGSDGNYWNGDQRRWYRRVRSELQDSGFPIHADERFLESTFGIQSMCFQGTGLSASGSRVFLSKNIPLAEIQYWRVDLGRINEGRILP
jgi:TIR domain